MGMCPRNAGKDSGWEISGNASMGGAWMGQTKKWNRRK